jgi:DNA-binding HxlR family transcriptional regulator
MPSTRRYDDPCGIARALDVTGDRWALLVVRELIFGPKRFAQLRSGLHGVSPNVLSQRLSDLEDAGILRRDVLDPPANVVIYQLTDRGRALEPVLVALGRWGSQEPLTAPGNELSVNALLLALQTVFDPDRAVDATFALHLEGDWYRLTVADRLINIIRARTEEPTVTFETDATTLRAVAFGREAFSEAEREGRLRVTGDRSMAERFARMFPVPVPLSTAGA